RGLPLRRVELAAEVLLGHDVRRVLRPRGGELDVALLEGDLVALADPGVAGLPLDRVEGVDGGIGEATRNAQTLTGHGVPDRGGLGGLVVLHQSAPISIMAALSGLSPPPRECFGGN